MNKETIQLYVNADTNDGDYISNTTEITKASLKTVTKVAKAIKECKMDYNWATYDRAEKELSPEVVYKGVLTKKEIDCFREYVPYHEYGVHTIESIEITKFIKLSEETLL